MHMFAVPTKCCTDYIHTSLLFDCYLSDLVGSVRKENKYDIITER